MYKNAKRSFFNLSTIFVGLFVLTSQSAFAASSEELAKKLANPVASMISVPFQYNYDADIGPKDDGDRSVLNIQPVVPFSLDDKWNIISRTILPVVSQSDIFPGAGSQSGVGDIVESVFFSPKQPTSDGWIWGAGPVLLIPTGSDDLLTADKWGVGPTAVALKQDGPWTYGALGNHIWSVAGKDSRGDISATFLQPFATYTTKEAVSYTLNLESTYDWKASEWAIPLNGVVSKVLKIGDHLVSVGGGLRYWMHSTDGGPEGLGVRIVFTVLFPK